MGEDMIRRQIISSHHGGWYDPAPDHIFPQGGKACFKARTYCPTLGDDTIRCSIISSHKVDYHVWEPDHIVPRGRRCRNGEKLQMQTWATGTKNEK
ncbi:MAG: hypothetical protein LBH04_04530 [Tannerellaceae bacterium]|nr:hypothetical protein [Tannerellaceae bacterium]